MEHRDKESHIHGKMSITYMKIIVGWIWIFSFSLEEKDPIHSLCSK